MLLPRGQAAAIVLNEEQVSEVSEAAKRFAVVATVNGYSWRTTVTRMGGEFLLGLSRAVREHAGVEPGDTVDVELKLDTAPREVDVPRALADALAKDAKARTAFERLAYTHRKEYPTGPTTRSATKPVNGASPKRCSYCGRVRAGHERESTDAFDRSGKVTVLRRGTWRWRTP